MRKPTSLLIVVASVVSTVGTLASGCSPPRREELPPGSARYRVDQVFTFVGPADLRHQQGSPGSLNRYTNQNVDLYYDYGQDPAHEGGDCPRSTQHVVIDGVDAELVTYKQAGDSKGRHPYIAGAYFAATGRPGWLLTLHASSRTVEAQQRALEIFKSVRFVRE